MSVTGNDSNTPLEVIDTMPNIAPISDAVLADIGNSGQVRLSFLPYPTVSEDYLSRRS